MDEYPDHIVDEAAQVLAQHQPCYGGPDSLTCTNDACPGIEWEPFHQAKMLAQQGLLFPAPA